MLKKLAIGCGGLIALGFVILFIAFLIDTNGGDASPEQAQAVPTFTPTVEIVIDTPTTEDATESTTWYQGGTLHQSTIGEWRDGSERDRLATAADWVVAVYDPTPGSLEELHILAGELVDCVSEVANDPELADVMNNSSATEIGAACVTLMAE